MPQTGGEEKRGEERDTGVAEVWMPGVFMLQEEREEGGGRMGGGGGRWVSSRRGFGGRV